MWSTTLINKLHIKTKYPTKYESYQTNDLRGIALTKYNYIESAWKCSGAFSSTKIVDSKWQDNMINYISWTIILPNMKAIRPTISEELHSQDITTMKMHEKLLQKLCDQNGGIIWSTIHHDQSSCVPHRFVKVHNISESCALHCTALHLIFPMNSLCYISSKYMNPVCCTELVNEYAVHRTDLLMY